MDNNAQAAVVEMEGDGHVCCLACVLKKLSCGFNYLVYMLTNNHGVNDISSNQELKARLEYFDPVAREKMQVGIKALYGCHPTNSPPVVHERFYQREEIEVSYSFQDHDIKMGKLRRGQIMELFMWNENCDIGNNVLDTLKTQFMETFYGPDQFRDLPNVPFDRFISICFRTGEVEVGRPQLGITRTVKFRHGQWNGLSLNAKSRHFSRIFKKTERLSMMIVKGLSTSSGHPTSISPWIAFLLKRLDNLDNMLVVFVVEYSAYPPEKVKTKRNARQLVNLDNSASLNEKIYWLDTSASDYEYLSLPVEGYHPEDEKKMNLTVRHFSDGCV